MLHWFLDHFWELPVSLLLMPVCAVMAVVVGTAVAISSALRERKGGKWRVVDGRVVWLGFSQSSETETGDV